MCICTYVCTCVYAHMCVSIHSYLQTLTHSVRMHRDSPKLVFEGHYQECCVCVYAPHKYACVHAHLFLCVNLFVCIHSCTHTCLHTYIYTHAHPWLNTCRHRKLLWPLCILVSMYVSACHVRMCLCECVCMRACVHVYTCIRSKIRSGCMWSN